MKPKQTIQKDGFALLTLRNDLRDEMTLSQYGAGLYDLKIEGISVTHAPKDYGEYAKSSGYHGKFVGPIAGRLEKGKIEVNGETWVLPLNENGNSLHSASLCFAYKPFAFLPFEEKDSLGVKFFASFQGSETYPADLDAYILYRLSKKEHRLQIEMGATPSLDAPINLTTHLYWNLGAPSVYPMHLKLKESLTGLYDAALLPKGFAKPTPALDFREGKAVGLEVNSPSLAPVYGYDHAFLVEEGEDQAVLTGNLFKMKIVTSAPGFQIYADNYPLKDTIMTDGQPDHRGAAITFEPVSRMDRPFLCPAKQTFKRTVTYAFERREARP